MKTVKKYTAIQLGTETVNDNVNVKLSFGEINGPYYSTTHPTEEFDTEEEAAQFQDEVGKFIVEAIREKIEKL